MELNSPELSRKRNINMYDDSSRKRFYEKRTETSKEKSFKINAKIEDVGLNED